MAYGLKYELLCTTRKGNLYTTKVYFDGYTGDPIDRNVPLNPFKLRKINKAVIRGTSFEYSIREEVDFEFLEFYTNNSKAIKVELYDPSNVLIWSGYNLPRQYQVPYVPAPASITFTATDGLGLLKNESFTLTGRNSQLDIIIHCIDKIGIALSYSIAINTFETTHAENRSPLAQTYEDCEIYEGLNCYEVVEMILSKYDAEITQRRGKWAITCTADKKSTRMIYTSAGVYSTTEAAPAVLDMGYPGTGIEVSPRNFLQMSVEPGGKQVKLTQDFGRKDSLLDNYNFAYFTSLFPSWGQVGTYTVSQGDKDGVKYAYLEGYSNSDEYIEQQTDIDNVSGQDFVFSLKFAPIGRNLLLSLEFAVTMEVRVMVSVTDGVDTWYLTKDGWQNTYGLITLSVKSSIGYPVFNELQVITNEIPASGTFTVRLYRYKHDTAGAGITYNGVAFKDVFAYFLNNGQVYPSALETTAVFDNSSEPENLSDVNVFAGDAPDYPNNYLLYKKITRLSDDSPTTLWHRTAGSRTEYSLLVQRARILASNNRIARQKLTGDIKGTGIAFDSIIKHAYNSNREFEIEEGTWYIYEEVFSVTMLELLAWSDESITFTSETSQASTNAQGEVVTGSVIGVALGNVAANNALSEWFEVVNQGTVDEYLRCKLPLAGDYDIQAFTDGGQFPADIWDDMPVATTGAVGGIILTGDEDDFLRGDGAWINITSGTFDHSALSNLAYADSGHTGFLPDSHLTDFTHANIATAYGWGNHASAGYAPTASAVFTGYTTIEVGLKGNSTNGYLRLYADYESNIYLEVDDEPHFAFMNGNVGIGTNDPDHELDVRGTLVCSGDIIAYHT